MSPEVRPQTESAAPKEVGKWIRSFLRAGWDVSVTDARLQEMRVIGVAGSDIEVKTESTLRKLPFGRILEIIARHPDRFVS